MGFWEGGQGESIPQRPRNRCCRDKGEKQVQQCDFRARPTRLPVAGEIPQDKADFPNIVLQFRPQRSRYVGTTKAIDIAIEHSAKKAGWCSPATRERGHTT